MAIFWVVLNARTILFILFSNRAWSVLFYSYNAQVKKGKMPQQCGGSAPDIPKKGTFLKTLEIRKKMLNFYNGSQCAFHLSLSFTIYSFGINHDLGIAHNSISLISYNQ